MRSRFCPSLTFLSAAPFAAKLHSFPNRSPFLSPAKLPIANDAGFRGQVDFFMGHWKTQFFLAFIKATSPVPPLFGDCLNGLFLNLNPEFRNLSPMVHHQLTDLPAHLSERIRVHAEGTNENGHFVLYWMRTAVRVHENPALEVAIRIADRQSFPILVYQAISQDCDYASDRHHMFMLEGARDVQTQLLQRGISYAFHLATRDDCGAHLATLAEQATLVVTEEMPVDPPRRFLKALTSQVSTPVICVDTACVVPMRLLKKHYPRAFEFRSATKKLYAERLTREWPDSNPAVRSVDLSTLPFQPMDLQSADLPELLSRCEIDHSVGPVVDTQGGSNAGYARWNRFLQTGLGRYAARRNNALVDGVSRMSAYLHYGMVSPMRIAREAAAVRSEGGEKYLDELLIWRELAYAFCFHRADHDQWSALPDWAQATLQTHAGDPRHEIYAWEQLARAQTTDAFWNAAQTSLLRQGELHNNVRMTWGKAILNWTKLPQDALKILIDLNHRYALDGRDPASFGGLLWCLGQFDRPFEPETKIIGTVRPRSTNEHAQRLDTDSYWKRVATPRFDPVPRVAVIGAGISGLCAARTLADHGLPVIVFDKGRGVGGRMSSRRVDGHVSFDHGAQYFTARDPRFRRYVDSWLQQGVVARWPDLESDPSHKIVQLTHGRVLEKPDTNERFVGSPSMNAVCKHLARDLNVQTQTQIGKIESVEEGIRLTDDAGRMLGTFERVIVSAPAPQSSESRCLQISQRNRRIFSFLPLRMPLILSSVRRKYGQNAFSGIVIPHQGTHTHARIHGSGESAATTLCSALGHQIHIPAPGNSPGFEYYE